MGEIKTRLLSGRATLNNERKKETDINIMRKGKTQRKKNDGRKLKTELYRGEIIICGKGKRRKNTLTKALLIFV